MNKELEPISRKVIQKNHQGLLYKTGLRFRVAPEDQINFTNEEKRIMQEIRQASNVSNKEIDIASVRKQIIANICKEDQDYTRKRFLYILTQFTKLARCN